MSEAYPFLESFNGSCRDECLNAYWFLALEDAREQIESWRMDCNHFRPHSSIGDVTHAAFANAFRASKKPPKSRTSDGTKSG
jgi:putative transposase